MTYILPATFIGDALACNNHWRRSPPLATHSSATGKLSSSIGNTVVLHWRHGHPLFATRSSAIGDTVVHYLRHGRPPLATRSSTICDTVVRHWRHSHLPLVIRSFTIGDTLIRHWRYPRLTLATLLPALLVFHPMSRTDSRAHQWNNNYARKLSGLFSITGELLKWISLPSLLWLCYLFSLPEMSESRLAIFL